MAAIKDTNGVIVVTDDNDRVVTLLAKGVSLFNAKAFGAKGDIKSVSDAVMNAGSAVLTSATAAFTAADVGKLCSVGAAGAVSTATATTSNVTNPTLLTAVSSTASMSPGMAITGTGIPAGTTIVGIRTANSVVEISQAATAAGTVTVSFSGGVSGTITGFTNSTTVTLSVAASNSVTAAGCTFGTDDTVAILALGAAAANYGSGATIFIPGGSYYCAGLGATALAGISVIGVGAGSSGYASCLVGTPGSTADMITLGKWGLVENLGIQGGARGVVITDAYVRLQNVEVVGASTDGIAMTTANSVGASLRDVKAHNCLGNGINVSHASAFDSDFVACTLGQNGLNGFKISASDQACTNIHSWGNGTLGTAGDQNGIRLISGVAGCRFTNCFFETNYGRGVYSSSANAKGHSFTGCWFWRNIQQGLYFFTGTFITISGCTFWEQGYQTAAGAPAIQNDTGSGWSVTGNTFFDSQGTKTQTYAYQELGTANNNTVVGNNMQAANLKTGSNVITGAANVPVAASMGTLNNV